MGLKRFLFIQVPGSFHLGTLPSPQILETSAELLIRQRERTETKSVVGWATVDKLDLKVAYTMFSHCPYQRTQPPTPTCI